ncbi:hypothetical protein [Roseibium sp. Sym1]|uniref:hypothetical protein n=1 Tax=Roseibium sp. Sym1 TaxID=3016006 RepID=UPI0022B2BEE2|nr:hypothetical protein [Roseibium sp. Sym1]
MFTKVSKLSAPIAGAILLASVGFTTTASAAPQANGLLLQAPMSEMVVKVDHRKKHGRKGHDRGGWNGHQGWGHHAMGPRQIRRSLRHRGFHKIRILDRRGPMFIVKARAWGGQKFRLVVDSRNAQIVRSRPIGHRGGRHGHWSGRWY